MNPQPLPNTEIKSFFSKIPWWPGFIVAAIFLIVCIVFLILFIRKQPSAPSSTNLNQCNDTTCPHGTCVAGVCNYKCDELFNCPGSCDKNNKCQPVNDCSQCNPNDFTISDMKTWIDCDQEKCQGTGAIMAQSSCAPSKLSNTKKIFDMPFSGATLVDSLNGYNKSSTNPTSITAHGQIGLAYTPDKTNNKYTFNTCEASGDVTTNNGDYTQFVILGKKNMLN